MKGTCCKQTLQLGKHLSSSILEGSGALAIDASLLGTTQIFSTYFNACVHFHILISLLTTMSTTGWLEYRTLSILWQTAYCIRIAVSGKKIPALPLPSAKTKPEVKYSPVKRLPLPSKK